MLHQILVATGYYNVCNFTCRLLISTTIVGPDFSHKTWLIYQTRAYRNGTDRECEPKASLDVFRPSKYEINYSHQQNYWLTAFSQWPWYHHLQENACAYLLPSVWLPTGHPLKLGWSHDAPKGILLLEPRRKDQAISWRIHSDFLYWDRPILR